ncbi:helicase-related protein [Microbulbifer pacificus]|uniref:helicase-related protein n=1 Tax=Microbulbifer pacificus TaxID=407164 RepID=UPI000CF43A51|nr:helicase-related protein [Microbulbifer pacificus]
MQDKSDERDVVACRLAEDLVGPHSTYEEITARPSDVYLTGILWPQRTAMSGEDDERLATAASGTSEESDSENDAVRTRSIQKPSVAGLSFSCASEGTPYVRVTCTFATYRQEKRENIDVWIRQPHRVEISSLALSPGPTHEVRLAKHGDKIPDVSLSVRCIRAGNAVLVTLTLVNTITAEQSRDEIEAATLFQTAIHVEPCEGTSLVPKPPRRPVSAGPEREDEGAVAQVTDEQSGALLYRNVSEFAVGHVCSAEWEALGIDAGQHPAARWVATTWLPSAIVEGVDPNGHEFFAELGKGGRVFDPLSAEALASADSAALQEALLAFCSAYGRWLNLQRQRVDDPGDVNPALSDVAKAHLGRCEEALERMQASVEELGTNPRLRRAFQLANLAMHLQHSWDNSKSRHGPLRWRPFQLGFLLLSAPSSVDRDHQDRGMMDLLWFPTGGGKTEAYLALIACVAVYRRLSDDPNDHSGVCALMRYTLRLLTTQQFARSAAMIVALEAIRLGRVASGEGMPLQGEEPFSIGLWVGGDATPNKRAEALTSLRGSSEVASPKQLARCPACSRKITWKMENATSPVSAECANEKCIVYGPLPVFTVDDDVYDSRPTLLIGTADKFAQIVRERRTNSLFGISDGSPPDLIIQDELHLISGPLGTIAGTYEAAFDLLFATRGHRTKIIGSTATIRRAPEQVLALFDRDAFQFPPPAIDHDDSGFAVGDRRPTATGRRYLGATTAGRSAKFTLQAVAGSLLQTAFGAFSDDVRKDAYWTLVGYFNSLRELGGALVLMQDDVTDSISLYAKARSEEERPLSNVEELTSRRTQEEIRGMLDLLDIRVGFPGAVDAVLATNMVSVGVDISRLGLMLVNGQPKTIAEYIQSTSRVGRGGVSGLVVSVLNNAKARDRSHFETFCSWHQTLYRDVEATSVTPFASRARDRAMHAALVAAVRHLVPDMLDSPRMDDDAEDKAMDIIDRIVERANRIDPEERAVREELERRLDAWRARSPEVYWSDYKGGKSLLQSAERAAARRAAGRDTGNAWPTLNSMRTVEAGTPFRMAPVLRAKDDTYEE